MPIVNTIVTQIYENIVLVKCKKESIGIRLLPHSYL